MCKQLATEQQEFFLHEFGQKFHKWMINNIFDSSNMTNVWKQALQNRMSGHLSDTTRQHRISGHLSDTTRQHRISGHLSDTTRQHRISGHLSDTIRQHRISGHLSDTNITATHKWTSLRHKHYSNA